MSLASPFFSRLTPPTPAFISSGPVAARPGAQIPLLSTRPSTIPPSRGRECNENQMGLGEIKWGRGGGMWSGVRLLERAPPSNSCLEICVVASRPPARIPLASRMKTPNRRLQKGCPPYPSFATQNFPGTGPHPQQIGCDGWRKAGYPSHLCLTSGLTKPNASNKRV